MITPLDAALRYAAKGWRVLPIRPGDKRPATAHGVHDATSDPAAIRRIFGGTVELGVGIACGAPGPMVLDVDPRNGGDETLDTLTRTMGPLPVTLAVATGGGGAHYYLRAPEGYPCASGKLGAGLDWKGLGGYVVAPPSGHPSGGAYRWATPRGTPFALVPPWLVQLTTRPALPEPAPVRDVASVDHGARLARAAAYLDRMPPSVSGQNGHGALFAAAQAMVRRFLLDPGEAEELLLRTFNPRCSPPWSVRDVRRKVREAARAGRVPMGAALLR